MTLNGISHRATENLTIGNIAIATADHGRNPLYAKAEVGIRSFNFHSIRLFHQPLECLHTGLQFAIVQRADFEVKVLKSLCAHPGKLCH